MQELVIILFMAAMGFGIIIFLAVSAVIVISERIAILRHQKNRGAKKEIKRKLRKEIFRRLRARQKIVRLRKKEMARMARYRSNK